MRAFLSIVTPLLGAHLATSTLLPAQSSSLQGMRRAAAVNVLEWAPNISQFAGHEFLLDRRPIGLVYDRQLRPEKSGTDPRTGAEVSELASALRGRVATDADYFACKAATAGAACNFSPSSTALVRIGEPRTDGDTSIVTVNISVVASVRGRSRPSSTVYAVWLVRSGANWTAVRHKEVGGG